MTASADADAHAHCDPDICFKCKMEYWRAHGVGVARIPAEKGWGTEPSLRARERDTIERARINGYDPVRV